MGGQNKQVAAEQRETIKLTAHMQNVQNTVRLRGPWTHIGASCNEALALE